MRATGATTSTTRDGVEAAAAIADLQRALRQLDAVLRRAVERAQAAYGPQAAGDPHRGLYIGDDDVERLLARPPGGGALAGSPAPGSAAAEVPALVRLRRLFGLDPFAAEVVLVALAPELDLRYERLYAYLQDDVTRRRPSVDLVLDLLCTTADERLARRRTFSADAPLRHHGLIELVADPAHVEPPLLARYVKLDEQIVRLLLGDGGVDARLARCCRLTRASDALDALPVPDELKRALPALARAVRQDGRPLRVYLWGRSGAGKRSTAEALAGRLGLPSLAADLGRARDDEIDLRLLFREASLQDALLYLGDLDALLAPEQESRLGVLLDALAEHDGPILLGGAKPWSPQRTAMRRPPAGLVSFELGTPDASTRRSCWERAVKAAGLPAAAEAVDALAARFRLTPGQIDDAVERVRANARADSAAPSADDLFAAARAQAGQGLAALARKVAPTYGWSDIVLPPDCLEQLREICDAVRYRSLVHEQWGFERKLALGKGINILFAGPSGTGKTMAAEIVAAQLALDLYKINLATVVSKYVGETEKNLARIFGEAEASNAILFFDEADALFGKRSEVRDSHDRYANIEISYLLQRMEEYDGVVVLATNLRKNMDEAFVRRMHFTLDFPLPGEQERLRIWESIWPDALVRDAAIDFAAMARRFELAGGNIRNIALTAAFQAATDGGVVAARHLIRATRREYQKLGKIAQEGELDDAGGAVAAPDGRE